MFSEKFYLKLINIILNNNKGIFCVKSSYVTIIIDVSVMSGFLFKITSDWILRLIMEIFVIQAHLSEQIATNVAMF